MSTRLGSDKYQSLSHWFDSTRVRTRGFDSHELPEWEASLFKHRACHNLFGIFSIQISKILATNNINYFKLRKVDHNDQPNVLYIYF